jgi:tetratricopeptide (TPR) repeat protein
LAAELHVGLGYARLARDEFVWARYAFGEALALEPANEDGLAGFGEVLLKFGEREAAFRCFDVILALGFREDHDLMLQVGRALFREGIFDRARDFFEFAMVAQHESAEAASCMGYASHRLGNDSSAIRWLNRALDLDPSDTEVQIYLGNVLYDRGDYDGALQRFVQTDPGDHIEELALWRYVELKKSMYRLDVADHEVRPWVSRLRELAASISTDDMILAEIESTLPDGTFLDPRQLDFFGAQLTQVHRMHRRPGDDTHDVTMKGGATYAGTWEQIVLQIQRDDVEWTGGSLADYMVEVARKSEVETGVAVSAKDAESFIRGIADAGLLNIKA